MDRLRIALALSLCFLGSAGFADDTWWNGTGMPSIHGPKHPSIQMVKEDLHINVRDEKSDVKVRFVFKNHGPATKVTMAFPEYVAHNKSYRLERFQSRIDGRMAPIRYKVIEKVDDGHEAAWLKEVAFGKGQSRVIDVSYTAENGGNTSGQTFVNYVLKTGAAWKGDIEELNVIVDWSGARTLSSPDIFYDKESDESERKLLKFVRRGKRQVAYTFRNLEPDGDLLIQMHDGFWGFEVNGKPAPQDLPIEDYSYTFAYPVRRGDDVLVPYFKIPWLLRFGGEPNSPNWDLWADPASMPDARTLNLGRFRSIKLKKDAPLIRNPKYHDPVRFVSLREVMKALGGTYRFDKKREIAVIGFK